MSSTINLVKFGTSYSINVVTRNTDVVLSVNVVPTMTVQDLREYIKEIQNTGFRLTATIRLEHPNS